MGLNDEAEKVRQAALWLASEIIDKVILGEDVAPTTERALAARDHLAHSIPLADAIKAVADELDKRGPDQYPRGFYEHLAEEAMSA